MDISGKVAIITGSGSRAGIGRSTAVALAKAGAMGIVINYSKSEDAAMETAQEVESHGARTLVIQADVSQDAQVRAMVQETVDTFGRLDILMNNAAWTSRVRWQDMEGLTDEIWDRTMAVNLKGGFYCIRAAAPHMRQNGGVVINVTSVGALRAIGSSSLAYSASKAGIVIMTQIMARALAPDIRVNCVCPGFVDGQWLSSDQTGIGDKYAETRGRIAQRVPLRRVSAPEDIAEAVLGLVRMDMVTGQTLVVDGGYTIRD